MQQLLYTVLRHVKVIASHRKWIQVVIQQMITARANEHLPHHHSRAQPGREAQFIQPPGEEKHMLMTWRNMCYYHELITHKHVNYTLNHV